VRETMRYRYEMNIYNDWGTSQLQIHCFKIFVNGSKTGVLFE
jgi:hypothetical protein